MVFYIDLKSEQRYFNAQEGAMEYEYPGKNFRVYDVPRFPAMPLMLRNYDYWIMGETLLSIHEVSPNRPRAVESENTLALVIETSENDKVICGRQNQAAQGGLRPFKYFDGGLTIVTIDLNYASKADIFVVSAEGVVKKKYEVSRLEKLGQSYIQVEDANVENPNLPVVGYELGVIAS